MEGDMVGIADARYVRLIEQDGHFELALYDSIRQKVGHGYKGPTVKRAEADLKYWTREKGLDVLPDE
jgi:hypothetical protein